MEENNALQTKLAQLENENQSMITRIKALEKLVDDSPIQQQELQQNELRLQLAIELTNLGTWEWNPINGNLFWSQECKNIYGIPHELAITFDLFTELTHPEDRKRVLQVVNDAMASDEGTYEITNRIVRYNDQTVRWIKVKGKVDFDENHKPVHFMGTVIDFTDNKKTQEKILTGERLFKSIALNIPNSLILVIDKNHRFVTIEGDIMERMGYDSSVFVGKHPKEISSKEKYESSKTLYDRVLAGEKFSIERKSDNGEDFIVHFVPLKDDHNEVEAGLIIALDITDTKAAEEKSAKLAAIIESSDDAIVSKTLESIITSWNDAAERIFGYQADEMIGESILKLIPLDLQYEETEILSRLKKGERVEHFETKRLRKDGILIDVSLTISPIKDKLGNIIGLSKIARDITEAKSAEEKSAKLAAIIDSSDDAIISKTLESIVTSWNDSAQRTFGYTPEEMIGESILKLIPQDRQHEETRILSQLRKGERVEHFETKRLKKDGTLIDVSLTISPIKDKNGTIIGLSKIARDITEWKKEEQRKNDFVAIVSHELKTPLTSIMGYVQLLLAKSQKEDNEFNTKILSRADAQTRKMTIMIQDFLNLAKVEEGKIKLNVSEFNLKDLIVEIASDSQFSSSKHEITLDIDEGTIVKADRDKIGQVFSNLLSNAIKYSPQGGAITIASNFEEDKVKIAVRDNGIGISLSDQKRLFDRFFRVNNDIIKLISGFGIGLYFTSEILRYHQSNIHVISKEGEGSTFYFLLDRVC
jgi:two-component system sensor histidine kinase VicK